MLFAHLADTHLGYRQYNLDEREEDFYRSFREAVDRIIDEGCRFVVHSGDLFDEPRPHVRALVVVREELERLAEAGVRFYCIAGNHDLLMRRGAVQPQRLYPQVEFLTPRNPARVQDGVLIAGLPYISKLHLRVLREKLEELGRLGERYGSSILVLHQGIDRYLGVEYELRLSDLPGSFTYYALGHIHKRILERHGRGVLAYPGSTEVWRSDEIDEYERAGKGFYIAHTDAREPEDVEWVRLAKVRRFMRLRMDSEAVEVPEVPEGAVVRLELRCPAERFQEAYRRAMRVLAGRALYVDVRRVPTEEEGRRRARVEGGLDEGELLGRYLEGCTEEEKAFARELLRVLGEGRPEDGVRLAEEFFRRWAQR